MIVMILGGPIATLQVTNHTPRWLAWSTFVAGIIVMGAGLWAGVEQNQTADAMSQLPM